MCDYVNSDNYSIKTNTLTITFFMVKRITQILALVLVLGCAAAVAAELANSQISVKREEIAKKRTHRAPKSGPVQSAAHSLRTVYGGANGDKPLYGLIADNSMGDGPFAYWYGAVEVKADGGHNIVKELDYQPFSGCYFDGNYLVISYPEGTTSFTFYDSDWNQTSNVSYTLNSKNTLPYAMTYDPTTGTIYCCVFESATSWGFDKVQPEQFARINFNDISEPVVVINSELPVHMRALACDKEGNITGIGLDGMLYDINKFTGEATPTVEVTGLEGEDPWGEYDPIFISHGRESAVCDWETGDIYFAYSEGSYWDTYIARIDPKTGNAETVANLGYDGNENYDVFTGLYFKQQATSEKLAPSAATDLTVEAVGTNLQAKVTFKAPTTDTNGDNLSGQLTWRISNGNDDLADGTTTPGATVTTTVDVQTGGTLPFVVYISQNGSESAAVNTTAFIGPDTPVIDAMPTVRANGNRVTLSWHEPYALNNGNLGALTYKITRMPDDVVLTETCTALSYVDNIESDIKRCYTYIVEPKAGNTVGEAVTSRSIYVGTYLELPWVDSFTDSNLFMQYPVIDANNDNNTWEINTNSNRECAYYASNDNDADDYLLIGPFKMKGGDSYTFKLTAEGHNIRERVAVYVGTDPDDVSTFSIELQAPTDVLPSKGAVNVNRNFTPKTDGIYYFGIKACSPSDTQYLYINDISVTASDKGAPAAPEFEAIPGATTATLKITLPTKNIDGTAVGSINLLKIFRDSEQIASISENLTPGGVTEYVDKDDVTRGNHVYEVVACNEIGDGTPAQAVLFRGLDYPGTPRNLRIWEDINKTGLLHITFDHAERGYNGGYFDPETVTYSLHYLIMGRDGGEYELGKGTNHTFQISGSITSQDVFAGSVYGINNAGSVRSSWATTVATFGPAIDLPIHESWAGLGQKSGIWTGQTVVSGDATSNSYWEICEGSYTSIKPQDGDGGMMLFVANQDDSRRRFLSPRFSLEGTTSPTLVFYYYYTEKLTDFKVQAYVDDKPIADVQSIDIAPANRGKWIRASVPLKQYAGCKYLQLGFTAYGTTGEEVMALDNVTISELRAHNLSVVDYAGPSKVNINEVGTFVASIRNNGTNTAPAGSYKIHLYKNGNIVCSTDGIALAPDTEAMAVLRDTPSVVDPSSSTYYIGIEYAADEYDGDDQSIHKVVRIITPDYPTVTDLAGEANNGVTLTWSDPSTANMPGTPTTESFENYDDFTISNFGDWTVYDGDGKPTVVMAMGDGIIEFPHYSEPMAWIVFDPEKANVFANAWYARTGKKMLVSLQACIDNTRLYESEDWLISPELNGARQVISFYGRAGIKTYSPETFDFMVSSTGNQPADFTPLAKDQLMVYDDVEWPEYTFTVPEGTRYFAIVHKSYNKFAMLIDDITYIPAGSSPISLDLMGFNVYRNGKRLNSEPVVENEYVDNSVEANKQYTYHVSTVWDQGEAPLSNPVTIEVSTGINGVTTSTLVVTPIKGAIRIEGGEGQLVEIFTTTGMRVATATVNGTVEIPVGDAGVYIVKAGSTAEKVVVR